MTHTHTRTMATLEVTPRAYAEVAAKLRAAGYDHAFQNDEDGAELIDMHGIALKAGAGRAPEATEMQAALAEGALAGGERSLTELTTHLGQLLDKLLAHSDAGWALVTFTPGEDGRIAYASNAAREDVAQLFGALAQSLPTMGG